MFLTYLVLASLIAMAILTQTESSTTQQTELIPVRANDTQIVAQKMKAD